MSKKTITLEFTDEELNILSNALEMYNDEMCESCMDACDDDAESYILQVAHLRDKIDYPGGVPNSCESYVDKAYEDFKIPEEKVEEVSNQLGGILSSMGINIE